MDTFTPLSSAIGGALIGLSATLLLLFNGRIAGISGILAGAMRGGPERPWRLAFVAGLVVGGLAMFALHPAGFAMMQGHPLWATALGGLIVGYGVRLGSGCTSGHGVCGLSRRSPRSLAATLTFIGTGAATVWLLRASGVTS